MNAAMRKTGNTGVAPPMFDAASWPAADDPVALEQAQGAAAAADEAAGPVEVGKDMPAAASEQQLVDWIEALEEQDERALAALYDATFARVFGLVKRIVRNAALAEEVVEDAYFQVWRQAARFDPARGRALTWLLAMARARAIDALRREARFQHECLGDELQPEVASELPAADMLLDLARHQADLHQALMLLGVQPRQLVSLAFFRGLSHEEIAQQTQLPLGTVKSQIRRALAALRQTLGDGAALALAS